MPHSATRYPPVINAAIEGKLYDLEPLSDILYVDNIAYKIDRIIVLFSNILFITVKIVPVLVDLDNHLLYNMFELDLGFASAFSLPIDRNKYIRKRPPFSFSDSKYIFTILNYFQRLEAWFVS